MRNAWHFRYALILLVFSAMRKVGSCVAHPLTRRYKLGGISDPL
ncbi:DUF3265 domain-containing protein [Vibrio metschnikovii]|nr:DUF3265 domain-containing protein [Vibrio metschnikovii]EKO3594309.1 DUF3265 domain-containing protein [Vibrio metschnikovii]EKO3643300.1 DUF3265 domain-containing protein [Vibrio metschnikovii]EKO3667597.1 DUF3265 domain-containing protein [Vibrio metschnikovii]EKO3698769.1 DUF3265 domain-containing protein [Vibrio metschnikovii]